MISRLAIRTEAWTAVFRGADDDRVIAAAKKGVPTSWCAQYSSNKLANFSLKNYGSNKARRMERMCEIYVTQDDEAFEYSDAHFASYSSRGRLRGLFCVLCQPDTVLEQEEGPSALFALCRQHPIVVRVTR